MSFVLKMMNFVLKMMNFVLKMMICVLQTMDFVLKTMNYVLNMMGFVLNMMGFADEPLGLQFCRDVRFSINFPSFSVNFPSFFCQFPSFSVHLAYSSINFPYVSIRRNLIETVFNAWPSVLLIGLFALFSLVMFAVLSMHLLGGSLGPEATLADYPRRNVENFFEAFNMSFHYLTGESWSGVMYW